MLRNQHQISIKCDSWCRQWRFYEDIPGHRLLLHVDIQWTMSVENNKTVLITYNNNNNSSHHVMLPNKSFCKIHFLVFASPFLNVWSNYIYHASYCKHKWVVRLAVDTVDRPLDICTNILNVSISISMCSIQSKLMFKHIIQKMLQEDTLCFCRTFFRLVAVRRRLV